MSRSIKALSTIEPVKCMVCKKGDFTKENPPIKYLGYTDHLLCFKKDFIKKFIKKYPDVAEATMEAISPWELASINGLWAALVTWVPKQGAPEEPETAACILSAKSKKQLEEALEEKMAVPQDLLIMGIFSKGVKMPYATRISIHIVEETAD